jgi:vacuolar-type H+-ATPase subunit I/STV1
MSLLEVLKIFLHKEKALYTSLNKFKKEDRILLGFGWVAKADIENMMNAMDQMKQDSRNLQKPTFTL